MDFYGEDRGWRFVVRAHQASEVFAAMMWRARLSMKREQFNLLHLAVEMFPYHTDYGAGNSAEVAGSSGAVMREKIMGPVVPVSALVALYEVNPAKSHSPMADGLGANWQPTT